VAVDAGDWREEEAVSSASDQKRRRRRRRRRRRVTEAEQSFLLFKLFKGGFNKIIALCESVIKVTFIHIQYV
jgi:hypothetical protein